MMGTRLPHKLRLLRVRQGLTLVEAAEKTGVTRATLSDLERGNRHPVATTLVKIAEGYGVPIEDLLEEEEPALAGKV
jgi:transcriptional regulator with XRE-family HTH domain